MKVSCYTALAGGYDDLPAHPEIPGVEFIAFVDDTTIEPNGWELRPLFVVDEHPRMAAKQAKVFPHVFLPDHDASIWIDASHEILTPHFVDHCFASLVDSDIALYSHPWRDCIYDEADASFDMHKYAAQPIMAQVATYRDEYPAHGGLYACGTLARRHTPDIALLMAAWWDEIVKWTYQDQLSFPVVCQRLGIKPTTFPMHQVFSNSWTKIHTHHRED